MPKYKLFVWGVFQGKQIVYQHDKCVLKDRKIKAVSAGAEVLVLSEKQVYTLTSESVFRPLEFKQPVQSIECGPSHSFLITSGVTCIVFLCYCFPINFSPDISGGGLHSWGANDFGQLGVGDLFPRTSPTLVCDLEAGEYKDVCAGGSHSGAITSSGMLYLWGAAQCGQLSFVSPDPYVTRPRLASGWGASTTADHNIDPASSHSGSLK
jgi:hypothetical protein